MSCPMPTTRTSTTSRSNSAHRFNAPSATRALALKAALSCDGISTRQQNEPAGDQDVWHYHVHVFPRYADDGLYGSLGEWSTPPG